MKNCSRRSSDHTHIFLTSSSVSQRLFKRKFQLITSKAVFSDPMIGEIPAIRSCRYGVRLSVTCFCLYTFFVLYMADTATYNHHAYTIMLARVLHAQEYSWNSQPQLLHNDFSYASLGNPPHHGTLHKAQILPGHSLFAKAFPSAATSAYGVIFSNNGSLSSSSHFSE